MEYSSDAQTRIGSRLTSEWTRRISSLCDCVCVGEYKGVCQDEGVCKGYGVCEDEGGM